ncbi:hypothetical protein ACFL5V_10365 [Fibrobacterota bacterium]
MKKFKTTSILVEELKALQHVEQEKQAGYQKAQAEVARKQSEIEKLEGLIKSNPELLEEDSEDEPASGNKPDLAEKTQVAADPVSRPAEAVKEAPATPRKETVKADKKKEKKSGPKDFGALTRS